MVKLSVNVNSEIKKILDIYEDRTGFISDQLIALMIEHFLYYMTERANEQMRDTLIEDIYQRPLIGEQLDLHIYVKKEQLAKLNRFFEPYHISENKGLEILLRYTARFIYNRYLKEDD